jgi:hypothetical protein
MYMDGIEHTISQVEIKEQTSWLASDYDEVEYWNQKKHTQRPDCVYTR